MSKNSRISSAIISSAIRATRAILGESQAAFAANCGAAIGALCAAESGVATDDILAAIVAYAASRSVSVDLNQIDRMVAITRGKAKNDFEEERLDCLAARAAADLSQLDLATATGLSRRTINAIEVRGQVTDRTKARLAAAFADRGIINSKGVSSMTTLLIKDRATNAGRLDLAVDMRRARTTGDRPATLAIRLALRGSKPCVWREIEIPSNASFEDLHVAIQAAFHWRDSHLHQFDAGVLIGAPYMNDEREASSGRVHDERFILLKDSTRTKFSYEYDFGDRWIVDAEITACREQGDWRSCPVVIAGEYASPIENCGGIGEYNRIMRDDRAGRMSRATRDWFRRVGYLDYKADFFDRDSANAALLAYDFDIPVTCRETKLREQSLTSEAPHIAARDERREKKRTTVVPVRGVEIVSVEAYDEREHETSGAFATEGVSYCPVVNRHTLTAMGLDDVYHPNRSVSMRLAAAEVLGSALSFCQDIEKVSSYPYKITYRANGQPKTYIPDLEFELTDGSRILVQIINEDGLPMAQEYQMLASKLGERGHDLVVLANGYRDHPLVHLAMRVSRSSANNTIYAWDWQYLVVGDGKPVKFGKLLKSLMAADLKRNIPRNRETEWVFAWPERQLAETFIFKAAAAGLISIDPTGLEGDAFGDWTRAVVGSPGTFANKNSLRWLLEDARPGLDRIVMDRLGNRRST